MSNNYCKNGAYRSNFARDQGGGLTYDEFDDSVTEQLVILFKGATVADFGSGLGWYTNYLIKKGIQCKGYDGIRKVEEITKGQVKYLDLSKPISSKILFDWILCFEVGEHIPKRYEDIFIQNLHQSNKKGIVLSWAILGQSGTGHVNCKINYDIRSIFFNLGYICDFRWEKRLRESVQKALWLKKTIMVFRKCTAN